jgi:hypothetical protein
MITIFFTEDCRVPEELPPPFPPPPPLLLLPPPPLPGLEPVPDPHPELNEMANINAPIAKQQLLRDIGSMDLV